MAILLRTRFDQLGKQLISTALDGGGEVDAEFEVVGPAQAVDVWFRPDPARFAALARAGLLGRLSGGQPCMFEPFRNTPGVFELQGCLCKQYALYSTYMLEAKRQGKPRPGLPRLWLISTGKPKTLIERYTYEPMPRDWPTGCYQALPAAYNHFLVVIRELPPTPDTLLLRLLGRGGTYRRAARELAALPDDAWEKQVAWPLLVALAMDFPQDPEEGVDMRVEEYLRETRARYAEWERRLRDEGRDKWRDEGRRNALRELLCEQLEQRFGELPADVRPRLDQATADELRQWASRVLAADSLAAVFAS